MPARAPEKPRNGRYRHYQQHARHGQGQAKAHRYRRQLPHVRSQINPDTILRLTAIHITRLQTAETATQMATLWICWQTKTMTDVLVMRLVEKSHSMYSRNANFSYAFERVKKDLLCEASAPSLALFIILKEVILMLFWTGALTTTFLLRSGSHYFEAASYPSSRA